MSDRRKIRLQEAPYAGCGENIIYPQGIKWTRQRKNVYQVLWSAAEPLSAIQIYNLTEKLSSGEEYAVSTVYRILAVFEEKGLVEKSVWMGDGTAVYELNRGGHTHYAVCLSCRRRIPFLDCPFAHISMEAGGGELADFSVTGHKLELYGYCGDCRKKEKR